MTTPCFELRHLNGEPVDTGDCVPHFRTESAAREAASDYKTDAFGDPQLVPQPVQLDAPCMSAPACAVCGADIADDDYVCHFETLQEANDYLRGSDWGVAADGTITCPEHRPQGDAQ